MSRNPGLPRLSVSGSPPSGGGASGGDEGSVLCMGRISRLIFGDRRDARTVLIQKFGTDGTGRDELAAAKSWARGVLVDAGVTLDATQTSKLQAIRTLKNSGLDLVPAEYLVKNLGSDAVTST